MQFYEEEGEREQGEWRLSCLLWAGDALGLAWWKPVPPEQESCGFWGVCSRPSASWIFLLQP